MTWKMGLSESADRELTKLDPQHSRRNLKFRRERVAKLEDPRGIGKALHGSRLGEFWRYRLCDFRIVCKIEDDRLVVLVIRIGHGKEIYR
jgi:mRNA interferase RelE/StbE